MEKPLQDVLFDELQKRGVSVYRFARLTGIAEGRLKGWKAGKGSPKWQDAEKIQEWLGKKVDPPEQELVITPSRYIERLEHMNDTLEKSIQLSLNAVLQNQKSHQQGLAEFAAELTHRLDEITEALHTLGDHTLKSSDKGSVPGRGKKGRVKP
jgi:transcriptional regulator with XRE-family HTH domain